MKAGGCYGAVAWRFSRIPTAPSRLSATALASAEHGDPVKRGACFRLARTYHQPPLRRIYTALVGTEDSNFVCSSGESTNYGFLGGGGALPFVPRYRMFESTSPPAASLRTIIPSGTGVGWSIPLSLILSPGVSILSWVGAATDEEQVGQSSPRALWPSASSGPR
jgi:hypothetical protein